MLACFGLPTAAEAAKPGMAHSRPVDVHIHSHSWWDYYFPRDRTVDLGVYGGALLLNDQHELFSPSPEFVDHGFARMWIASPDVGLRVGYFPLRFVGLEAEGGVMPSGLREREGSALLYTARGQLVGRLELWRLFPFVLVGGGVLGVHSKPEVLGRDVDAALHFGAGAEVFVNWRVKVRFDARDVVSWRQGTEASFGAHSLELTLGLAVRFP